MSNFSVDFWGRTRSSELVGWLVGGLVGWWVGGLVGWLVGWWVGWLVGGWVGRWVGGLVGRPNRFGSQINVTVSSQSWLKGTFRGNHPFLNIFVLVYIYIKLYYIILYYIIIILYYYIILYYIYGPGYGIQYIDTVPAELATIVPFSLFLFKVDLYGLDIGVTRRHPDF